MTGAVGGAGGLADPASIRPLKSEEPAPILSGDESSRSTDRETRLREVASEFEAVFIQEMLKAMRSTVPEGGLVDGGQGEEMFTSLMDEHVAQASAHRSEGSLAEALYRQFVARLGG